MRKIIGILGGIGPIASANFYKNLIIELQNRRLIKQNKDYPQIIINSIPAPELFENDDIKDYIEGVKTLEKAGVNFVVIVCNTAHLHFEELQNAVKIPIIDLRQEVKKYLSDKDSNEVLILGSKLTMDKNLFNFRGIMLTEKDKEELNKIIENYNIGKDVEKQKKKLLEIIKKYNPKLLVSACTEISSLLEFENLPMEKIDTMNILLEATINSWLN